MSPRLKARIAGAIYFLSLLVGLFGDYIFHDKAYTAGLLEIAGMVLVTLLFYAIFQPVNKMLALIAASVNLVAMVFEAQRVNPHGQDVGLIIHGMSFIVFGYLIFRSTFLPRILGVLMAIAGLSWLTYLSTPFQKYNLVICLFGEGLTMLWLLIMGVNEQRWQDRANAAGKSNRT